MLEKKTASSGSKTKEQNGAEMAWRHPHSTQSPEATPRAPNSTAPTLHSQLRQEAMLEPFTVRVSPWHQGHSWGQDHLQGSYRQWCVAWGHVAQSPPNHTELPYGISQLLLPAEPHGCCNKTLGTPRQSKHKAQPGTGTGWTLEHSALPMRRESQNPLWQHRSSPL